MITRPMRLTNITTGRITDYNTISQIVEEFNTSANTIRMKANTGGIFRGLYRVNYLEQVEPREIETECNTCDSTPGEEKLFSIERMASALSIDGTELLNIIREKYVNDPDFEPVTEVVECNFNIHGFNKIYNDLR